MGILDDKLTSVIAKAETSKVNTGLSISLTKTIISR